MAKHQGIFYTEDLPEEVSGGAPNLKCDMELDLINIDAEYFVIASAQMGKPNGGAARALLNLSEYNIWGQELIGTHFGMEIGDVESAVLMLDLPSYNGSLFVDQQTPWYFVFEWGAAT